MKIIDILNKIANGEEVPKKILYDNKIYIYDTDDYYDNESYGLFDSEVIQNILNDKVEILETTITYKQDKIEKLDYIHPDISCSYNESELLLRIEANKDKINEIIDRLYKEVK